MKLRYICCILFIFLIPMNSVGQSAIEWQKCFGGTKSELGAEIEPTPDGGYIIAGSSLSLDGDLLVNRGDYDMWLVKTDDTGKIQWQRTFGGAAKDVAASVKPTADGGYILIGTTESVNGDVTGNRGKADIWVAKPDGSGVPQWKACYGGPDNEEAAAILEAKNGGYLLLGTTLSSSGDVSGYRNSGDMWVVKLSSSGAIEWQKCLGGTSAEKAGSIGIIPDGGYIVAGSTFSSNWDVSFNHGDFDYWVVALSESGAIQWEKTLGGSNTDQATSIAVTADSGYIVAGLSSSKDGQVTGNHGLHDFWIVKLDKTGSLQWQKSAGGSQTDVPNSIVQTQDGGYAAAGTSYSINGDISGSKGNYDYWVAKFNASGILERQVCLGGSSAETAMSVKGTPDGKLIVAGESYSVNGDVTGLHGNTDIWVVKLQSALLNVSEIKGRLLFTYPEPVKDVLYLAQPFDYISVYSLNGKKIQEAFYTDRLDIRSLPTGAYLISALDKNKVVSCKRFLKE